MTTIPQEGLTVERQLRSDSCYSALATVGVERKSTHASMVRGTQGHEGIRAEAAPGPLSGGMNVAQCCT